MDITDTQEQTPNIEPTPPVTREASVNFSGDAQEFFGIWIVNLLLTIVTFGIYSAWAKVRTQQYFYGNTSIEGHAFSYLAQPLQILKGRILAVILFAVYSLTLQFAPLVGIGIFIVMLFLIPWILNQSLRFNLRMSSYRNVRFSFKGNYGDAFVYWILLPIASIFTMYLMMPWAMKKGDEYVYNNISYGDKALETKIDTGQYYETILWIFLVCIGLMFGVVAIAFILGGMGSLMDFQNTDSSGMGVGIIVSIVTGVFYVFSISILSAIYRARIRNHILNNSEFDGLATFKSKVEVTPFAILMFTNIVALIFTAGLAYPWMKVRTARFLAQATTVVINNDSDDVLDAMSESQSAFGEEAAEVFDIDIALT